MNELARLSDTELDNAIAEIEDRKVFAETKAGRTFIGAKMRECIGWLKSVGYKFEGDEKILSDLWAKSLSEEFVRLGESGLKNAVMSFAANDSNEYKAFPQIPWIKEECRKLGGDPRAEKGRREQKLREQALEEEHRKEFERWKIENPERWAEIQAEERIRNNE